MLKLKWNLELLFDTTIESVQDVEYLSIDIRGILLKSTVVLPWVQKTIFILKIGG